MNEIIKGDLEYIINSVGDEFKKLEGKTIVMSGGAGFLGTYFLGTIHLLNKTVFKKPCRILSLDNFITASKNTFLNEIYDENIKLIKADVRFPVKIDEPVDFIIHAAGLASPAYYKKYPMETIEAAIFGAKNLLELAREKNVKSFLFFSSSEIYGDPDPNFIPTPETYKGNVSCTGPRSCYDESKRLAETICMTYHQLYGTPVKIVRPFNVYGPGMNPNDKRVVPTFITQALAGEPLTVYDNGNQTRTFCYISDAVSGFWKVFLSEKNGEVYNVGTDKEEINMASLAKTLADIMQGQLKIKLMDSPDSYPADEPSRRCPDITKVKKLGFRPGIDLRTGLDRTLRYFKETWHPEKA